MYPAPQLSKDGYLAVPSTVQHRLYWQEYGNAEGHPVIILHGGPGSGAMKDQARLFDPEHYRIIMFDQRGAGQSTPHASLQENTTEHLIEDINAIRRALQIEGKMHLFGGSWGSTLALAYAIKYPENITSLTLYGIFLGRKHDIADFYQNNAVELEKQDRAGEAQKKLPNEWRRYVEFIPQEERTDMMEAYHLRLSSDNAELRLKAAQHWNRWERAASKKTYDEATVAIEPEDAYSLAHARMENHYFRQGLFLGDGGNREQNYILDHAHQLKNIPIALIQGEHDHVCPPKQAKALYDALNSISDTIPPQLHLIETAGHTMRDPGMIEAIVEATDCFRNI